MLDKIKSDILKSWLSGHKTVIFLFAILLFIGFWRLPYSPSTWYDEGINVGVAQSLVEDGVFSLKVGPDEYVEERQFLITTNYPVLLPVALSLKIFGANISAARFPMILFLFGFALSAYLLARKWYGERIALSTLALIVVFLPFYGNGKCVLGEVPGLFFLLLGLFYVDAKKIKTLFFSGLFFGLAIATKPFFLIILPALVVGEAYGFWKKERRSAAEYCTLFFGVFIPMMIWLKTIYPDLSLGNMGSMFRYYANSYADKTDMIQLILSNAKRFIFETTPLHFLALFAVSVLMLVRSGIKKEARTAEIVLMIFIIINLLWYLKTPGWYRYFFPAHLVLFVFFPAGLAKFLPKRLAVFVIAFFIVIQSSLMLSKRNEVLYYSTETQDVAAYIESNSSITDSILAVNSPSAAFLLSDRPISQYVRINPELVFAPEKIKNNVTAIDSEYIVASALTAQDVALQDFLLTNYQEIKNIGHYTLYKRKNDNMFDKVETVGL